MVGSVRHRWSNLRRSLPVVRDRKAPVFIHDCQSLTDRCPQYNFLSEHIKEPSKEDLLVWLARLAFIGFVASVVSDSVSNSLRVVKTFRQVSDERVSYSKSSSPSTVARPCDLTCTAGAARRIISEEGILGLMGRGLKTRILANGLQGLLFSILWKLFQDM